MCSSVVGAGDCSESFVSCSIPDLKFDFVAVEREGFEPEVDSDGCQKNLAELVISVSDDNR